MISKSKINFIRSLSDKTTRHQEGLFLVEGRKCMTEFMHSDFEVVEGFFTEAFVQKKEHTFPYQIVTQAELDRITTLSSNRDGVLVVRMKKQEMRSISRQLGQKEQELILVLDGINDPGNLGTIIRIADWYGVTTIICSMDTVDCYNPKVLMATMGSFTRVSVVYADLEEYFSDLLEKGGCRKATGGLVVSGNSEHQSSASQAQQLLSQGASPKIYGAYLDGESTHIKDWGNGGGYLVIGSEAHGISANLEKYITDRVTIPRFGLAESLNAGVATAVILDRMRG